MQRIYVSISYFKTFHYLFFSLAVFSLTAGIMLFDLAEFEALSFFGLSFFYCASSLLVAHYFYKNYRELAEPFRVIRIYLVPYIILLFWTFACTAFLIWIFPYVAGLVYSFLFINYYIFFVIIIGFVSSRFRVVSKFFEVYDLYMLRKAKGIAKQYALTTDAAKYEVGSDPKIDEMLDEIWTHRTYPIPFVRKFESAVCEKHVIGINRMLRNMTGQAKEKDKTVVESLEKMKEDYLRKIKEIAQKED